MEINALTVEISKLSLKPGDILALKLSTQISPEQRKDLADNLLRIQPDGVKIAVLYPGMELQIIEAPEPEKHDDRK